MGVHSKKKRVSNSNAREARWHRPALLTIWVVDQFSAATFLELRPDNSALKLEDLTGTFSYPML